MILLTGDNNTLSNIAYKINNPRGLSSNAVYQIYPDKEGIIWIGTFGGGINVLNPQKKQFSHYTQVIPGQNGLSHKSVLCFCEDENNILWIGTDGGGLNRFDRKTGKFFAFRHNPSDNRSLSSNVVTSVYRDRKGNLWVGTYNGGLNLFDRKKESFVNYRNNPADTTSLINNNVWVIHEDKENNLWIGTLGGLELFDRVSKTFRHIPRTIINNRIFPTKVVSILEDKNGKIWIGGIGIAIFDKQQKNFMLPKALTGNWITCQITIFAIFMKGPTTKYGSVPKVVVYIGTTHKPVMLSFILKRMVCPMMPSIRYCQTNGVNCG
ncbi:MAG: hypothetical protein HC830_09955 [Bacteroidetes bacterium]|nr:hypothetical protein [Bacteroidota bacterium]